MTSCYIDTSALLRWVLQSPGFYSDFGNWDHLVSSVLLKLEFKRSIDRLYKMKTINSPEKESYEKYFSELEEYISWIDLDSNILNKAGRSFTVSIGTLDAIHLMSAYLYQDEFETGKFFLLTHDKELGAAAETIGLDVKGIS